MSEKILLQNMVFYGFHGVYEFERELGQRFYVDVEMTGDLKKASDEDDLQDTIDYVNVYNRTKDIVENHRYQLLEALAGHIAGVILNLPRVSKVTVRVRKPSVPIAAALDHVQVEVSRSKDQ
ncbi:MAG TPA: dihydroneopterin aldolase [Patescibacteria group bacterium]|nr:dihydroneopterin aldolase [Patescibacteria group bacterium]